MKQPPAVNGTCPHCSGTRLYLLADGRLKCGLCRTRFSSGIRRSRLEESAVRQIITGFMDGRPALALARTAKINPKTVQEYYARIRALVASLRETHLTRRYGAAEISPLLFGAGGEAAGMRGGIPLCCILEEGAELALLPVGGGENKVWAAPESAQVAGWLVAADRRALETLQMEKINCLPSRGEKGKRAQTFWMGAKRRLAAYHGGFRQHFQLYLREMEFRENMEQMPAARREIEALLVRRTISGTGESDA